MNRAIEQAMERVIATMRDNLGEQLTVDDMARAAMFSKFHFTRIFRRLTGVSPGRFLSALRLQQAKQLLVSTSLNVADISVRVGYNSVGTFSSRFTRSVGVSPTTYRRLGGFTPVMAAVVDAVGDEATGVVSGRIFARLTTEPGLVFVGLFPTRLPEGPPVLAAVFRGPGHYLFDQVPEGHWYVHAQCATGPEFGGLHRPTPDEQLPWIAEHGPVHVRPNAVVRNADLRLEPMRSFDPPVLPAPMAVCAPDKRDAHTSAATEHEAAA